MYSRRSKAALLIVAVGLFPLAVFTPLACCAGVADSLHGTTETMAGAESHCGGSGTGGGSCCDRAPDDTMARRCCQGGDSFERPHSVSGATPALLVAVATFAAPLAADLSMPSVAPSARDPIPRLEPLYTLHASLLI